MESSDELIACRACLAVDGRLYAISGSGFEDTLAALTGIALPSEGSFPRHLCVFCMTKLSKCAAFRDSCQRSTKLLNTLIEKGPLKKNCIKACNRKLFTNQLTHNKLFQLDTGAFIVLKPLIKTENNENSHKEAKSAVVYGDSENYIIIKDDASDLDKCTSKLPTEKQETSEREVVKSRAKNIVYARVKEEIENHNSNLEIDDCLESEEVNYSSDDANVSEIKLPEVRNRKRTRVPITKNNTAKRLKKYANLQIKVDKHPPQINTNGFEATTGSSNTIGIKSVGTELVFEKKNNRNTRALNKDVQKQKRKSKENDKSVYNCDLCGKGYKNGVNFKKHKITHTDPNVSQKEIFHPLKKVDDLDFEKMYNFEVKLLSKEEQKQRIEEKKKNPSAYSCDVCGKEHHTESSLAAHKTSYHDPSLPLECDVCFYRFSTRRKLRAHQLDDQHRYVFTCKECGRVTTKRVYAKHHYSTHQGQIIACPYCDRKYNHQSSYYVHIRLAHRRENEACDECGETFAGKVGLLVHKGMRHRTNDKSSEILRCSVCEVKFLSAEALENHAQLAEGVSHAALWPCAACGENTGSETALAAHAAEKHPHDQLYCEECNKMFSDAASFALHVDRKHLKQQWPERARRGPRRQNQHIQNQRKQNQDQQNQRKQNQDQQNQRKQSQQHQQGQRRRVVCEICGKFFICMATLQYHMNGHLGLRPYQCEYCPKAFIDKTKLTTHLRVHTGEKPYKCEQCPMAFAIQGNFQRHMKNVHLKVQVACSTCGKMVGAASLRSHVRAVHMNQRQVRPKRTRTKKPALES